MDRRVQVDQVKEMLIKTRESGIQTGTFIMVGYPGETMDDIEKTAQYLVDSLPDHFTITKSYPIRGTDLFTEVEHKLTSVPKWSVSTDREIDFKRTYSDRSYHWAIRYIYNRVELERCKKEGRSTITPQLKSMISKGVMRLHSLI